MKFIIDENLSPVVSAIFRSHSLNAFHVNEMKSKKKQRVIDDQLRRLTIQKGYVIVTKDDDFVKSYVSRKVPDKLDELLKLKGVGRKTANLTLILGHDKPGICVDIHVHRISNRWGYVKTKSPYETEMVLRDKLPRRYWKGYNNLLVTFGQNICKPVSPFCGSCPLAKVCPKTGVTTSRY